MTTNIQHLGQIASQSSSFVYSAPLGSTFPESPSVEVDLLTWIPVGYISQDEDFTLALNVEEGAVTVLQGRDTIRGQSTMAPTLAFTPLEQVKSMYEQFLSTVTGTDYDFEFTMNANAFGNNRMWLVDMGITNGSKTRILIPNASVNNIGDFNLSTSNENPFGVAYTLGMNSATIGSQTGYFKVQSENAALDALVGE